VGEEEPFLIRSNNPPIKEQVMRAAVLITLIVLSFASPAAAQREFGVIDNERVVSESKQGRRILQELEQFREAGERQFSTLQLQISNLRQRIIEGASFLGADELARLQAELDAKLVELAELSERLQRDIQKLSNERLEELNDTALGAIEDVRRSQNIGIVISRTAGGLVYFEPEFDITDLVIARMEVLD
jgi:Skp family chaperone for outer membrane proteins